MITIIVPYHLQFAGVVASAVEEAGRCFGADDIERQRLRLLAEEAFTLIVTGVPEREFEEMFHLQVDDGAEALQMRFSSHGKPLDVRVIPDFSSDDPESTLEGLPLDLLRNLCDDYQFRNLGRQGWELLLRVRLAQYVRSQTGGSNGAAPAGPVPVTDLSFRKSVPQDAADIINLVYNTYRYSYVKSLFYNKEKLSEAIAQGQLISAVALTPDGRVIGHNGIIVESPCLGEAGMAMIEPDFRKGHIFLSLVKLTAREVLSRYPNMLVYAKTVTSHKASQAFTADFTPCLLQLSVYPHASFIGITGTSNPRESLVFFVNTMAPALPAPTPLHVPSEHLALLQALWGEIRLQASLVPFDADRSEAADSPSVSQVHAEPDRQHASLRLEVAGSDLVRHLRQQSRLLQQEGIMTIDLLLPTARNQGADTDRLLLASGFFFCGVKPEADGAWTLVYCNLLHQKFAFDNLQLFSSKTRSFCSYVRSEYTKTLE